MVNLALCPHGRLCRGRSTVAGARAHACAQACRARAQSSIERTGLVRKPSIATPPLQTLSRHKIFCHDRNGSALGKHCLDTRGPLSRPKYPVPAPNPFATQNFCHDAGQKIIVATEKASVATQTTQHAWEPCRNTEIPIATQGQEALSHAGPSCKRMPVAGAQAGLCT